MTQDRQGEVYDLGYQRYDGPREGRLRTQKALWSNTVRTALGAGRGTLAVALPGLLILVSMGPALLIVLLNVLAGPADLGVPGQAEYYEIILLPLLIFSAIVAPQLLCPDRRDRVIALYLVRPMSATDYIFARWLALFVVMFSVIVASQTVLLGGLILAAGDPVEYVRDNWMNVPKFLASGVVIALLTTTIPLAVSSFITRQALAAAAIIGVFLLSAGFAGGLTECENGGRGEDQCEPIVGEYAPWFALAGLVQTPLHINDQIFGTTQDEPGNPLNDLHGAVPIGWYGLIVGVSGLAMWRRYQVVGL
jgi:ABC-2 type transport system permease protein